MLSMMTESVLMALAPDLAGDISFDSFEKLFDFTDTDVERYNRIIADLYTNIDQEKIRQSDAIVFTTNVADFTKDPGAHIKAFEDFGFEVSTVQMPFNIMNYSEELVDQINVHMDRNDFDLAYSLNCNPAVAEACYIHDTPYIGWCYDSPSYTGSHWYLHYPTTHVFAFDSSDAESYKRGGVKQAYYLPLAANLKAYDKVIHFTL